MRKLPPLAALRAFEAAARHLSFKSAASELGVTPTAVSHQIRNLEEFCGQKLFRRRPRPLALTSAGETLFPVLCNGFDVFVAALDAITKAGEQQPLRVTSPNAFASRWLVPRLPQWRARHPKVALAVIGTDAVLDLRAGDADLAIRYARTMPRDLPAQEIFRDSFYPVCTPDLLAQGRPVERAADLLQFPLIWFDFLKSDAATPNWRRWLATARSIDPQLAEAPEVWDLSFCEELHAINAVLSGQGIAICSDVVVGRELASGELVKAHSLSLPGYGFYIVHLPNHGRMADIQSFAAWMRSTA